MHRRAEESLRLDLGQGPASRAGHAACLGRLGCFGLFLGRCSGCLRNRWLKDFKQSAHRLIDQLPDSAGWEMLAEKARFLAAVERGIEAADRGEFASDEQVKAVFARWGVAYDVGPDAEPREGSHEPVKSQL